MVILEDNKYRDIDRPGSPHMVRGCANECSGANELARKEKEIDRMLMIAEKDKRESMQSLVHIRQLGEQLQDLLHDFQNVTPNSNTTNNSYTSLSSLQPVNETNNLIPTQLQPTNVLSQSLPIMTTFSQSMSTLTPLSPILEKLQTQPNTQDTELGRKEAELRRVVERVKQEAEKATSLRRKKEDLQQQVLNEVNMRRHVIRATKQNLERKEKEITRLSLIAEQDKKTGMFLCQQIGQLKKAIEGFLQAREDSKPEALCKILQRCASTADLFGSPPTSPLASTPPSCVLSPVPRTALGRELLAARQEEQTKDLELARVTRIVDNESRRVETLKSKVEELKQGLVDELQEADEELGMKMQEFVQKQLAIEKVAARAERERARSLFLKEEIVKLTTALAAGEKNAKRKGKRTAATATPEYGPDKAYLSEFSELCDLETLKESVATDANASASAITPAGAILASSASLPRAAAQVASGEQSDAQESKNPLVHAASLPMAIQRNLRAQDPTAYIFSPPLRQYAISPVSGSIYAQKLKDIAVLHRETTKKDEELARMKKLAEAERCRHLLLKDKFDQLRMEMRDRECATL